MIIEGEEPLPVELTGQQIMERVDKIGRLRREIVDAKEDLARAAKLTREKIRKLAREIDPLFDQIEARAEERMVKTETVYHYTAGTVTKRRKDTGAIIEARGMTGEERQAPLMPEGLEG